MIAVAEAKGDVLQVTEETDSNTQLPRHIPPLGKQGATYKEPMSEEDAIKELKKASGKQFDPELVGLLLEIIKEKRAKQEKK